MKKRIKNSYGYTLLEVIAAVIILGIILLAAIAGYTKYVEKSKKNYYKKQQDLVTQAGKDYFNDNRGYLPNDIGEQRCVLLDTLISKKYIDPVKNYDKKACSKTKSKVCAQKISLTKYEYETVLDCGSDYKTTIITPPSISFKLEDKDFSSGKTKIGEKNKSYEVIMNVSDSKYSLKSYKYVIHKEGNNTPFFVVGPVKINEKTNSYEVKIPFNNTGTFYIEAVAYNVKGKQVTKKSGKITLSFDKMNCETAIKFSGGTANWTNKDINSVISSDEIVSYYYLELKNANNNQTIEKIQNSNGKYKINDHSFTYKIAARANQARRVYYEATPYDQKGKNNSCVIKSPVYQIDTIKPICTAKSSNSEWTNQNVVITVQCSDNDSKCVSDTKNITISGEHTGNYNTDTYDNAGNKTDCNVVSVNVDKTAPSASITAKNLKKEKDQVQLKCDDKKSGINGYYFGKTNPDSSGANITYVTTTDDISKITSNDGMLKDITSDGTYYLSCRDIAGNTKVVSKEFYKTTLSISNGSVSPKSIITAKGNSFAISTSTTVTPNTGYSFNNKWYKNSTTEVSNTYAPTSSSTIYAKCSAKTFTLTLDPNGGEYNNKTTTSTKTMTYDSTNNNSIGKATKTGYSFLGWYTSKTGGTQVYDSTGKNTNASSYWTATYSTGTWKHDGNVTLYARWSANKYRVVLVPNKGNLIQNGGFDNFHSVKGICNSPSIEESATSNDIHVNGWPTYDLCTSITYYDYASSYDKVNKNVTLSAGKRISQQLPDILENNKWYAISVKVNEFSGNLDAVLGLKHNGTEYDNEKFSITTKNVSNGKVLTYVFKLSNYSYTDNYINNYDNTIEDDEDLTATERYYKYLASDRPEIYLKVNSGSIKVDDFSLTEASSIEMYYDSEFNLVTSSRIGYDFAGWYINNNAANNASNSSYDKYKIEGSNNTKLTAASANCYDLDNPDASDSACFIYAGWVEKKTTRNGKEVPISDVNENNLQQQYGNNSEFATKTDPDKTIKLYSEISSNPMTLKAYTTSTDYPEDKIPNGYNYVQLNNPEHPTISKPGFGGFCQKNGSNVYQFNTGTTYYHIIIAGFGKGLYIHPQSEATMITDNEGYASTRIYAYKIKPSQTTKACVYFSQNPVRKGNQDILRDHMSANIYQSMIYTENNLPEYYRYLK